MQPNITDPHLKTLVTAIAQVIVMKDTDGVINEYRRQDMTKALTQFVGDAIVKYANGQKEHGGDIVNRDLDKEMYAEGIDSFWYNAAKKWK